MSGDQCYNCINPRICVLKNADGTIVTNTVLTKTGEIEDEIGWCSECSECKRCSNRVTHRIYWTVGCPATVEVTLCSDVCDDHCSVEQDCHFSQTARNFHSNSYTYL